MSLLVSSLRQAAEEAGHANRAAGDDLARQMSDTASSLMGAVALFQSRLEQGAADGVNRLAAPIEALLLQLSALADTQRQAGTDSTTALSATIARAADALEAAATKVAETLGSGASGCEQRAIPRRCDRGDARTTCATGWIGFGASLSEERCGADSRRREGAGGDVLWVRRPPWGATSAPPPAGAQEASEGCRCPRCA